MGEKYIYFIVNFYTKYIGNTLNIDNLYIKCKAIILMKYNDTQKISI